MLSIILHSIVSVFRPRQSLALENLALRQHLVILQRNAGKPRLKRWHRAFWVLLTRVWTDWQRSLCIVQPDTAVRWHRQGFRQYWRRKSRLDKVGRPKVDLEIRALIRKMVQAIQRI